MAFWGLEVKPGKPITYSFDKVRGRLRISQATLGIGSATTKSLVQCNVGNKCPVFLCALLPEKTESCHLEVEFEEAEDVIFSVIGPRSVHLTGYFVRSGGPAAFNSDTESYGEDIGNTETEESNHQTDDDNYEDSFIDDDELEVFPASPVSSDGAEGVEMDNHTQKKEKSRKRLKKKYQTIESSDDTSLRGSGDKMPLSVFKTKQTQKTEVLESREKIDALNVETDGGIENGDNHVCKTTDEAANGDAGMKRSSRKRKERVKSMECLKADSNQGNTLETTEQIDMSANDMATEDPRDLPVTPQVRSENGPSSKRRKKELIEEGKSVEDSTAHKEDESMQKASEAEKMSKDSPNEEDESKQKASGAEKMTKDIPLNIEDPKPSTEKKKKKKKKTKDMENEGNINMQGPVLSENGAKKSFKKTEDNSVEVMPSQVRTLSNGLTIEELATGEPNGKVASTGKKVKVYYTAMLKDNGHVLDSNIGRAPYKFRLGDGEVLEGWNIGLEGMRVGDKRRLVIPPSMGFGSKGPGENIPPNSWLVYEVELVGVRR